MWVRSDNGSVVNLAQFVSVGIVKDTEKKVGQYVLMAIQDEKRAVALGRWDKQDEAERALHSLAEMLVNTPLLRANLQPMDPGKVLIPR